MKTFLRFIASSSLAIILTSDIAAQTTGTLAVSFNAVAKTPCYTGTKHALAAWIQTGTGTYVKTKLRYAGNGHGTADHLATFGGNATGGSATNCMTANTTDATTGATLSAFGVKTFTWNGTNVAGAVVADGTYRVAIEETWSHGSSTTVKYYTFTKGPNLDTQSPADNADFTNVSIVWTPINTTGIEDNTEANNGTSIYPNPSNDGIFNVTSPKANSIKVINMVGDVLYNETVNNSNSIHTIDLSNFSNGIYFFVINDSEKVSKRKVVLNKQ